LPKTAPARKILKNWETPVAGKALRKRILSDVERQGGADWLYDQIASGVTVAQLARDYGCSRSYLSRALNANEEYRKILQDARVEAADALVEEGLSMVDELTGDSTNNEISATREKVNYRKFMAGALNQAKYGTRPQNNITLNIGDMHLDALRKFNRDRSNLDDIPDAEIVDE
jgi:AraC-like DNA-binding protein